MKAIFFGVLEKGIPPVSLKRKSATVERARHSFDRRSA